MMNKFDTDNTFYALVGHKYRILTSREITGGSYTLIESHIPPEDPGPPPHTHTRENESFYIIEGDFTFFVENEERVVTNGDFVYGPRGVKHTFRNNSKNTGKIMIVIQPSGFEDFLREAGEPIDAGSGFPLPMTSGHMEKVLKTAPKYGIIIHV